MKIIIGKNVAQAGNNIILIRFRILILSLTMVCLGTANDIGVAYFSSSIVSLGITITMIVIALCLISYISCLKYFFGIWGMFVTLTVVYLLFQSTLSIYSSLGSKQFYSFFLILFLFVVSTVSGFFIYHLQANIVRKSLAFVVVVLCLIGYINAIFIGDRAHIWPFGGEASHFALFFGMTAIMLFSCCASSKYRLLLLVLVLILALLLPNLTLLMFACIMLVIWGGKHVASIFLVGLILFFCLWQLPYFQDRLLVTSQSDNLSALVYLQGIQLIAHGFNGIGVGFQAMGDSNYVTKAGYKIISILGRSLNRQDGGFLAAKIIFELGVYGVFIVILYLYYAVRACLLLIRLNEQQINNGITVKDKIALSAILGFSVEMFVRGGVYFSGEVFILLTAISYLRIRRVL
ncbi:hypothetical protein [Cysteiniphilum halobium]|uniref:hypothetical protein n=1 Tax=Cysteiniphilum halobium TaxID=2219059 RepID=UPI0013C31111|nr:hypothetical protein [Cysteiniphilum halobium]